MSENLDRARDVAAMADRLGESPDARAVPTLLGGIVYALTGLLEVVEDIKRTEEREQNLIDEVEAADAALGRVLAVADELEGYPNATLKPTAFGDLAARIRTAVDDALTQDGAR